MLTIFARINFDCGSKSELDMNYQAAENYYMYAHRWPCTAVKVCVQRVTTRPTNQHNGPTNQPNRLPHYAFRLSENLPLLPDFLFLCFLLYHDLEPFPRKLLGPTTTLMVSTTSGSFLSFSPGSSCKTMSISNLNFLFLVLKR